MLAYCGNDPTNNTDPTGHAFWGTNTVAICDGGCGLSTEERKAISEVEDATRGKITAETLGITSESACRISKGSTNVNNPPMLKALAGTYDAGIALGFAGNVAGCYLGSAAASIVGWGCFLVPLACNAIINCGNPGLQEGGAYTVYEMDVIMSEYRCINRATGELETIKAHSVTTVYVLASGIGNSIEHVVRTNECYYSIHP